MNKPDVILTVKEAAALLKVDIGTMRNWTHIDGFPALRVKSCIRIHYDLLMEWVKDNSGKTVNI